MARTASGSSGPSGRRRDGGASRSTSESSGAAASSRCVNSSSVGVPVTRSATALIPRAADRGAASRSSTMTSFRPVSANALVSASVSAVAPKYVTVAPSAWARAASSAARRVLPIPGWPDTTMVRPAPWPARRQCQPSDRARPIDRPSARSPQARPAREAGAPRPAHPMDSDGRRGLALIGLALRLDERPGRLSRRLHPHCIHRLAETLQPGGRQGDEVEAGQRAGERRRLRVAIVSEAAASEHSRAATLRAAPRKPSPTGTASPASSPMPTGSGSDGSIRVSAAKAAWLCRCTQCVAAGLEDGEHLVPTQLDDTTPRPALPRRPPRRTCAQAPRQPRRRARP